MRVELLGTYQSQIDLIHLLSPTPQPISLSDGAHVVVYHQVDARRTLGLTFRDLPIQDESVRPSFLRVWVG
jgi:hypothetical protein